MCAVARAAREGGSAGGRAVSRPLGCPAACQLVGAARREPQLGGTQAASCACLPAPAHTGSHVADRTYMPRSPEGPGSGQASWAPSRPCRAPCLPASHCPGSASSLSLSLPFFFFFSFFFFPLSPSFTGCRRQGRGGRRRGCQQCTGGKRGREKGWGSHSSICLERHGCSSQAATIPSREVTSFPSSALCLVPQRRRGRSPCQAGSTSPMGKAALAEQLLCLGVCLGPCSCYPKQRGTYCCQVGLGPLGLSNMN